MTLNLIRGLGLALVLVTSAGYATAEPSTPPVSRDHARVSRPHGTKLWIYSPRFAVARAERELMPGLTSVGIALGGLGAGSATASTGHKLQGGVVVSFSF